MKTHFIKQITTLLLVTFTTLTASLGTINYQGQKETWYNLPMGRVVQIAKDKGIYGEYWEREDGVKMFGHYVIIAAPYDVYPYGTKDVKTSLGDGIVLDTGAFAEVNKNQIDIATTW